MLCTATYSVTCHAHLIANLLQCMYIGLHTLIPCSCPLIGMYVAGSSAIKLQVHFLGHYNEPRLDLDLPRRDSQDLYNLSYQPGTKSWQYKLTPEQ